MYILNSRSLLFPPQAILWSTLFKYHLELGHSEEAYKAMMGNPDPARWAVRSYTGHVYDTGHMYDRSHARHRSPA